MNKELMLDCEIDLNALKLILDSLIPTTEENKEMDEKTTIANDFMSYRMFILFANIMGAINWDKDYQKEVVEFRERLLNLIQEKSNVLSFYNHLDKNDKR